MGSAVTRTRQSAKAAGATFERQVADWLADELNDDRIDRRVKTGSKDRGDIAGVRAHGRRVVVECKNTTRLDLAGWVAEAQVEAGNDDALLGVVVHKRRGCGKERMGEQYVTMTLAGLVALLTGVRPGEGVA